jgi:hypothetical protein
MRAGIASRYGAAPSYRVVVPGAELRMLVLAAEFRGCVGVDLDSGAFVWASHPLGTGRPAPFDVVAAEIAGAPEPPDPARPEAIELAQPPRRLGRLPVRRAERLLGPLHHPPRLPLLGVGANAVPYWTLTGEGPSLALVDLRGNPRLRWGPDGLECHFVWQGAAHELPVVNRDLVAYFEARVLASRWDLERVLGYRPRRLLVMLTAPRDGYCHKAVGAILPA